MKEFFKIPRLYVNQPLKAAETLILTKPQSHYLKNVLRLSAGAFLRIFNGQDGEFLTTIAASGKLTEILLTEVTRPQPQSSEGPTLFFAPIKKNRMDFLIEKSVELGVGNLRPITTQRTIVRSMNMYKTHMHIIEAAEQCERLTLPTLTPLTPLAKALGNLKTGQTLYFCQERGESIPPLASLNAPENSAILVGPEGGFTPEEVALLTAHPQVQAVSLGETILRAETAALYALSRLRA